MTQSEKTESGHGGWGKARFWRRFDDRASDNLITIPLTRWFLDSIKISPYLSDRHIRRLTSLCPYWSMDSVCPRLPPPLPPYPTSIVCLLHTPEKLVLELYAFLNGYPVLDPNDSWLNSWSWTSTRLGEKFSPFDMFWSSPNFLLPKLNGLVLNSGTLHLILCIGYKTIYLL